MNGNFSRSNPPKTGDSSATTPDQQNQSDSGRNSPKAQFAAGQDQKPTYTEVTSEGSSPNLSDLNRSRTQSPEATHSNQKKSFFDNTLVAVRNLRKKKPEHNNNKLTPQAPEQIPPIQIPQTQQAATNVHTGDQGAPQSPPATSEAGASNASITVTLGEQGASAAPAQEQAAQEQALREQAAQEQAAQEQALREQAAREQALREEAALGAASGQTHGDANESEQPSAPNANAQGFDADQTTTAQEYPIGFQNPLFDNKNDVNQTPNAKTAGQPSAPKAPIQDQQTPTTPKKTVSCFKKHMKLIIISSIAVVLAGLIAAPFIYDSRKTLEVLNGGLEATNSLVGKTGLSKLALGGIALGVILAIALITLIALYIKGRNTMREANKTAQIETIPAAPTSFEIPELAKEMNMTINFNPADLETTKAFEEKKDELLIDKNLRTDNQNPIRTLIINMGNIASTDKNALTIAQKIVDNIDIETYNDNNNIIVQFNNGYFYLKASTNKLENLNTKIASIPDNDKNNPNVRIINITLSENREQQQEIKPNIKTDTMAVKFYHGVNKVLNIVTCNKLNLETKVTI